MSDSETKEPIYSVYGSVGLLKKYCPSCGEYSFVIDRHFVCCDRLDGVRDCVVRTKRESCGSGKRGNLSSGEKNEILERQEYKCAYCGCDLSVEKVNFDHVVPFSFLWTGMDVSNMVASCSMCNLVKSNKVYGSFKEAKKDVKKRRGNK